MPRLSDLSQAQIDLLEEVGKEIVEALKDVPLEVEGTPKATLKYPDGGYKVKPLPPGVNFFFASSYLGKKGEVIFALSPEDAQDFELTEFSYKAVDTVFPLAGAELVKAMELVFSKDGDRVDVSSIAGDVERMFTTEENFKALFDMLVISNANAAADAASRAQAEYKSDPNYGMF
jgi:hypothetical protein